MSIRFTALPTGTVRALQNGGVDAYGQTPERQTSDGDGVPCRHCLRNVGAGEDFLVLAYRPFPGPQPFAETGPIFLHALACEAPEASDAMPEILDSPDYIVRGYDADDRIVYGTGAVVPTGRVGHRAGDLFERPDIAYVHVRSARNNCYQLRIDRA